MSYFIISKTHLAQRTKYGTDSAKVTQKVVLQYIAVLQYAKLLGLDEASVLHCSLITLKSQQF